MNERHHAPLRKAPSLIAAVKRGFAKALHFSGCASRAELWLFILFWFAVSAALVLIWSVVVGPTVTTEPLIAPDGSVAGEATQIRYDGGVLGFLFNLACLLPFISLSWRRLHDRNLSGWWTLMPLAITVLLVVVLALFVVGPAALSQALFGQGEIEFEVQNALVAVLMFVAPLGAAIFLFVQYVRKGTQGDNSFGPPPYRQVP